MYSLFNRRDVGDSLTLVLFYKTNAVQNEWL